MQSLETLLGAGAILYLIWLAIFLVTGIIIVKVFAWAITHTVLDVIQSRRNGR